MLTTTRLWTAIITPLDQAGNLDLKSFEGLLKAQESAGNGVVILGSTGEGLNLSETEKKQIVEFTDGLNLQVPVMVGVSGFHLDSTLDWIEYLESRPGIHCYLVVTPLYAKPGTEGQYHWFKSILDRSTRPCMLYNVPSRTGVAMSTEAIGRLRTHPQFWSIKEASGSVKDFCEYRDNTQGQQMFSGDDGLMPDFAEHGCFGLVSVSSNVWPQATKLYVELSVENKLSAEEIQLWKEATNALFTAANPIPTKALLFAQGKIQSAHLKAPLHLEDLRDMAPLNRADKAISDWYNRRLGRSNQEGLDNLHA